MIDIECAGLTKTLELRQVNGSKSFTNFKLQRPNDKITIAYVEDLAGKAGLYIKRGAVTTKSHADSWRKAESTGATPVSIATALPTPSLSAVAAGSGDILKVEWTHVGETAPFDVLALSLAYSAEQ